MKIKATYTEQRSVDVELSDAEQARVVEQQKSSRLMVHLANRLNNAFIAELCSTHKFPGVYQIRQTYWKGEPNVTCLVEIDASWDYHNNHGVDETIYALTPEECIEYHKLSADIAGFWDRIEKIKTH